ncbi:MAG TPA: triple tyrosine motif-containing protein [Mucilaginibacter sp.]|jgi:DNA-binding CsgD family transcriptional regulator|nr:triple tyrosine motif-containing protein [Mucilaginibacter sp.]
MRKSLFALTILLLSMLHASAADIKNIGVPYVQNYPKAVYQSGNQNWSVTKDEHGIMYFGNSGGLLSFDGRYWQSYAMPNGLIVRSVAADGKGKIYAGGFGEFGYWENNKKGELKYHSLIGLIPKNFQPLNEEIWKIYVDDGQVIFQSFGTIFIYSRGKIDAIQSPNPYPYLFLFKVGKRYFIEQVNAGLFELKNKKLEYIAGSNIMGNGGILSILPFTRGRYVIGTAHNGLFIYDDKQIQPWANQANAFLETYQLNNGAVIPGKYFAYGTILNGIIVIDTAGNVVQQINKSSGLQNNTVLSLYTDNEQNLWAGLDNGIDRIELNSPLYFYFDKSGRFGTVYSSIIFDNKIYLGTNQGLFYSNWNANGKALQEFNFTLIPGSQGQVWELSLQDGKLLCGHNAGSFQVNGGSISRITNISGGWTLKRLNQDRLIQGTYTGLVIYSKDAAGNWIFDHKVDGFGEPSRYVEQDSKGQVWVSHAYRGIYKVTLSPDLKKAIAVKYYDSHFGLPGSYNVNVFNLDNRIVFSSDSGFYVYDDISDHFEKYQQLNHTLGSFAQSNKIIPALGKKYWFISHGRIALADLSVPGKLSVDSNRFSVLDGRMLKNYESISKINGSIYLVSVDDGFAILNDADIAQRNNIKLPAVLIRRVENITDIPTPLTDSSGDEEVEIPYSQNNIRISYALPFYRQEKVRYQYFLDGYSRQWSAWGVQTQKEFTNLDRGTYHFRVRARINDLNVSPEAVYSFTILPPWYATKIAWFFYIIALVGGYYAVRAYYRVKIKRHQHHIHEKLQKEHEEYLKQEALANEQRIVKIKNEQLQADLAGKSRELAASAMNIVYKNELLQKISDEIAHLKDSSGKPLSPDQLKRLQKVINDGMSDERDWNLFENSFNEAHESFFKKLKAQHPDLVPNDLKLCAYLRMNMSSKEMASLLNISLRGVEIRRYRLRKKLNLEHDKNLVEFLMEL